MTSFQLTKEVSELPPDSLEKRPASEGEKTHGKQSGWGLENQTQNLALYLGPMLIALLGQRFTSVQSSDHRKTGLEGTTQGHLA